MLQLLRSVIAPAQAGFVTIGILALAALTAFLSYFTVPQGYEAVVLRFGKAQYSVEPGLHFKLPFFDTAVSLDMREVVSRETVAAATSDRLATSAVISTNWQIKPGAALEFYKLYGTSARFENTILDRRLQASSKAAISSFDAERLIKERVTAGIRIDEILKAALGAYPVIVTSAQIENIEFPQAYMAAVLEKEKKREEAQRERYELERQKLIAERTVQVAEAEAKATRARADAEAYATMTTGKAKAQAAELLAKALSQNPALVQYEYAKRWNGSMPYMVPAAGAPMLMQMPLQKPDAVRQAAR
ncbi:MAG: prohibitin family protein [Pseudomonadota bacterium]